MRTLTRIKVVPIILFVLLSTTVCTARPNDLTSSPAPGQPLTASLTEISGLVQVLKPIDGFFKDAFNGQKIQVDDQVLTHQDSRVRIDLSNGTMFRVGPFSTFILQEMEAKEEGAFTRLKLEIGKIWIILRGGAVDVETPSGLASVRGSYLYVEVLPAAPDTPEVNVTQITCLEGECVLENDGGTVVLGAGETASVLNAQVAPTSGKMSHKDVESWIAMNPEATLVVAPLTATPAKSEETPDQTDKTPTSTMTQTFTPEATSEPTETGAACGPPGDWVIYIVQSGDTLEKLSQLFNVPVVDLQYGNCMGDSTTLTPGMTIFVPNVATSTPTKTPANTSTPKPTKTSAPKPTSTPKPTKTPTPTNTGIPSDSNAVFFNISRPTGSISNCLNYYKTDVIDPDGINMVKLYYGVNTEPSGGDHVVMDAPGGDSYEKHNFKISTADVTGTDIVYYRFAVIDLLGNFQYYPDLSSSPFEYTDSLDCGTPTNSPTVFSSHGGPDGLTITLLGECENTYIINVDDANGVLGVELAYSLDGGSSYAYLSMNPHAVDGSGNGTYELITSIDATGKTKPLTIKYKFKAKDGLSIWTFDTNIYSFTDDYLCGP